ncbi:MULTISPECIES: hypothetical protein [Aphanothece]|uniref:hypothetical protein n=1 Tax=Aphanothece TaxID=1121 RepID=UPI00398EEC98
MARMAGILPQGRTPVLHAVLSAGCGVALAAAALLPTGRAVAQEAGYGQTISSPQQERELDYGTGGTNNNLLDATNPMDLMNRLRRATALDEATAPDDAVDAALKDYHSETASPGASQVKAP